MNRAITCAVLLWISLSASAQRPGNGHARVALSAATLSGTVVQMQAGKYTHVGNATIEERQAEGSQVVATTTSGTDGAFVLPTPPMGSDVLLVVSVDGKVLQEARIHLDPTAKPLTLWLPTTRYR